jgi:hypothetical protein
LDQPGLFLHGLGESGLQLKVAGKLNLAYLLEDLQIEPFIDKVKYNFRGHHHQITIRVLAFILDLGHQMVPLTFV